jgi:hypothetical protein
MAQLCPFCSNKIPEEVAGVIEAVTSSCPSECDAKHQVSVSCPSCGREFWRKWVSTEYRRLVEQDSPLFTFHNQPTIDEIASTYNGQWYIEDGKLVFLGDEELIETLVVAEVKKVEIGDKNV